MAKALPDLSAVVCVGGKLAAAVRNVTLQQGLEVPRDLSLTSIIEPGEVETPQQALTGYDVEPDHIVDWVLELLFAQETGRSPREVIVPGAFRDRGSTRSVSPQAARPQGRHFVL